MNSLSLPGILRAHDVQKTGDFLASLQQANGLIPWFDGHYGDPWNHIESAMALTLVGHRESARRAFEWSMATQAPDGGWPMETLGGEVTDVSIDTNQVAYIAVGVWHHWLIARDLAFVRLIWPTVRRAIELVVDLQTPSGAISWNRDPSGFVTSDALLTGSASIVTSLRCALALAELVGDPQPDWEVAAARLAHAVARHPVGFLNKSNFAMDWYYPVLGGAVTGATARELVAARWDEFVVPGRGCRCVSDRPWVTAAETGELCIALAALGEQERALRLMRDIQFLRAEGGGYWTGWVFPEEVLWPAEQSSWTVAALLLACDALTECSAAHDLFRGGGLPRLLAIDHCDQYCYALAGGQQ